MPRREGILEEEEKEEDISLASLEIDLGEGGLSQGRKRELGQGVTQ